MKRDKPISRQLTFMAEYECQFWGTGHPEDMETTGRPANGSGNGFLAQYWAWVAFFTVLLLWWLYRPQIEANTAYETGMLGLLGIVIFFGWPQLTRNSLARFYLGVMLVLIALVFSFSVGLVLLPFLLLYVLIDLFFIAPRQR